MSNYDIDDIEVIKKNPEDLKEGIDELEAFTVVMEQNGNLRIDFAKEFQEFFTLEELQEVLGDSVKYIKVITTKLAKELKVKMEEKYPHLKD